MLLFLIHYECHYLLRYLKIVSWWIWNIERAVFCIKPRSVINDFPLQKPFPLCSVPVAGLSWGDVHVFMPSRGFWGLAEKLFYSEAEICVKSAGFHSWALFVPPPNYCWNGFLKAAHDKSFLWLWSFLSKQSSHGSQCEGSQSVFCKILHCTEKTHRFLFVSEFYLVNISFKVVLLLFCFENILLPIKPVVIVLQQSVKFVPRVHVEAGFRNKHLFNYCTGSLTWAHNLVFFYTCSCLRWSTPTTILQKCNFPQC